MTTICENHTTLGQFQLKLYNNMTGRQKDVQTYSTDHSYYCALQLRFSNCILLN